MPHPLEAQLVSESIDKKIQIFSQNLILAAEFYGIRIERIEFRAKKLFTFHDWLKAFNIGRSVVFPKLLRVAKRLED